jgi:hypothetical protein
MDFHEDQSRVRTGHAAENLTIIRCSALNLPRHGAIRARSTSTESTSMLPVTRLVGHPSSPGRPSFNRKTQ